MEIRDGVNSTSHDTGQISEAEVAAAQLRAFLEAVSKNIARSVGNRAEFRRSLSYQAYSVDEMTIDSAA